ncbi:MAG: peptide ABC transporter permease [Salinarimonas sp.]
MPRNQRKTVDPVLSAAAMLRRIGFMLLLTALPVFAMVSRRAVVLLMPIAVSLIIIAALIDGQQRPFARVNRRFAASPPVLATLILMMWIGISLIWAPYPDPAVSRAVSLVATAALGLAGYYALSDRTRSANLYLLPIGVAAAAVTGALVALAMTRGAVPGIAPVALERGMALAVLAAWPATAWMHSRGRDAQALVVAASVGLMTLLAPTWLPLVAFIAGAFVWVLAASYPRAMTAILATGAAVMVVSAPLFAFIATPLGPGVTGGGINALAVWREIMLDDPLRIVTGYGLEAAQRSRMAGDLPWNAPNSLLFEIWYELGIVGAVAIAIALAGAVRAAARRQPILIPGGLACFTSAFTFAALGIASTQMWWITGLIVVALAFVAVTRGQFRTSRPKMVFPGKPAGSDTVR